MFSCDNSHASLSRLPAFCKHCSILSPVILPACQDAARVKQSATTCNNQPMKFALVAGLDGVQGLGMSAAYILCEKTTIGLDPKPHRVLGLASILSFAAAQNASRMQCGCDGGEFC